MGARTLRTAPVAEKEEEDVEPHQRERSDLSVGGERVATLLLLLLLFLLLLLLLWAVAMAMMVSVGLGAAAATASAE